MVKVNMNFVTRKPKLFWLIALIAASSLVLGVPTVALVLFTGNEALHRMAFFWMITFWAVGFLLVIVYFVRQAMGIYAKVTEKPLREQIW